MAIKSLFKVVLSLLLMLGLFGCSGESEKFLAAVEQGKLQIQSLTISSLRNVSQRGEELSYSAVAELPDDQQSDFTTKVTWRTSDPSIATINGLGQLTALTNGNVDVIAEFAELSASSTLTVNDAALEQLALTPGSRVDVCKSVQLGATGTYSDGSEREIRDLVSWSIDQGLHATIIASGSTGGTIVASEARLVTVAISKKGVATELALVEVLPTLDAITVFAAATELEVDVEQQYTATGIYADGADTDITGNVIWASDSTDATIDASSGLLTTVSDGPVEVSASCGGKIGRIALTVTDSTTDLLQFLFDGDIVTSLTQTNDDDFDLTLQSVSSSDTTTDRTEDAVWSIRSSDVGMVVSVSNATDTKGQLSIQGSGEFVVQATYDDKTIILPITIETSTFVPPPAPG